MSQPAPLAPVWRCALGLLCFAAIILSSPWPGPQAIFQAFLVLAVASGFESPLVAMLWAAAGGWILEGSLRMYPQMGGTALANMTLCALTQWHFKNRPPDHKTSYWGQLAAFSLGHFVLTHLLVRLTAGPHAWGMGWLWVLLTIPVWGTLSLRLHLPVRRR
ncbi:hypothetical protein [Holophaga foetida]|uniref:hypothetical protein n=1 Tax=Holophaga foetida TaxID=35839 RepID=UPI00024732CE|nr:hypothetical protein [Holophaga foetida]